MWQLNKLIAAVVLALVALSTPVLAGDRALLNVIGYSEDGRYFAFEEYGIQDGSGFAYSTIYLVDVIEDRWVVGTPIDKQADDEQTSLHTIRTIARAEAQPRLDSLDIHWPADELAVIGSGAFDTDGQSLDFGLPRFNDLQEPETRHTLVIDTYEAASAAPCMDWFDRVAMGFTLNIISGDSDRDVHVDGVVPRSRGCPIAYRIAGVYAPYETLNIKRAMALIAVYPLGFEGPDKRYIAIPIGNHL